MRLHRPECCSCRTQPVVLMLRRPLPARPPAHHSAGYRHSEVPRPLPEVTRTLEEFRKEGMNDTEALLAMVAWGNEQPEARGWVVLALPEGRLTLETPLKVTRSKTVLRGAGSAATEIYVPKSLMQLFGALLLCCCCCAALAAALLLRRCRRAMCSCAAAAGGGTLEASGWPILAWRMPAAQVAGAVSLPLVPLLIMLPAARACLPCRLHNRSYQDHQQRLLCVDGGVHQQPRLHPGLAADQRDRQGQAWHLPAQGRLGWMERDGGEGGSLVLRAACSSYDPPCLRQHLPAPPLLHPPCTGQLHQKAAGGRLCDAAPQQRQRHAGG